MDQQLLKTVNRKQQNTDNVLLLVENCDIKLEILNKSTHLNQSETQITFVDYLVSYKLSSKAAGFQLYLLEQLSTNVTVSL